ncbi:hypothetical protein MJL48_34345, partial [Salmonella enterica subsp. enterica serovar Kentucky]|nr:hypothetical protein [Salmonella enterica subsp. enterica serovar Kentucky]
NLTNVVPAMEIMLDDFGFGLSKRRVTLSTSGVVPALDKLGDILMPPSGRSTHCAFAQAGFQLVVLINHILLGGSLIGDRLNAY